MKQNILMLLILIAYLLNLGYLIFSSQNKEKTYTSPTATVISGDGTQSSINGIYPPSYTEGEMEYATGRGGVLNPMAEVSDVVILDESYGGGFPGGAGGRQMSQWEIEDSIRELQYELKKMQSCPSPIFY